MAPCDHAGSTNMLHWQCRIPGKAGTIWEGGVYPLDLIFSEDYPSQPPIAKVLRTSITAGAAPAAGSVAEGMMAVPAQFPPGFFHVNCYDTGRVCLSIINPPSEKGTCVALTLPSSPPRGIPVLCSCKNP